jgi:hypothetical protein
MINLNIRLSIAAGMIAALMWSVADMLLVGFIPRPDAYPLFSQLLSSQINIELALLMLDGSPQRLMWGICLATLSVFLYLIAVYAIYHSLPKNKLGLIAVYSLFIGYSLSPIGHAGFGYIGLLAQSMHQMSADELFAQIILFRQFEQLLNIHWLASVAASTIGWLLVFVLILLGHTSLPRKLALFSPILTAPLLAYACSFFPTQLVAVLLGCACLNISQLLFFILWIRCDAIKN